MKRRTIRFTDEYSALAEYIENQAPAGNRTMLELMQAGFDGLHQSELSADEIARRVVDLLAQRGLVIARQPQEAESNAANDTLSADEIAALMD